MRRNSKNNPFEAKRIAKQKYAERQIDKWWKWSWDTKGKIKYKDIIKLHNEYKIECYGWKK